MFSEIAPGERLVLRERQVFLFKGKIYIVYLPLNRRVKRKKFIRENANRGRDI